jgi:hypothetical protein
VATTAKTTISTGITRIERSAKRRVSLSTATSITPVRRTTMNMPPMMKVKKTTIEASPSPRGTASMKSTRPTGLKST